MRNIAVATVLFAVSLGALAQTAPSKPTEPTSNDSAWVVAANSADTTYSIRKGSFVETKTKDGTLVESVVGQNFHRNTKTVEYEKLYVTKSDCDAGIGKLVILDTNGNYTGESDFVSKGDSVASGMADMICGVYQMALKQRNDKGLK
jgi:hypothetical protein